jgi:hypothetical protein
MRFPNLLWSIRSWGTQVTLAGKIGINEVRLSRCLAGRLDFTLEERAAIARVLGYPSDWLFQVPTPPLPAESPEARREVGAIS